MTGFTVYWPLTIGTVILLIVLFSPGGLLAVFDAKVGFRLGRTPIAPGETPNGEAETGAAVTAETKAGS